MFTRRFAHTMSSMCAASISARRAPVTRGHSTIIRCSTGVASTSARMSALEVLRRFAVELLIDGVALCRAVTSTVRRSTWVAPDIALDLGVGEHRRDRRQKLIRVAVAQPSGDLATDEPA